MHLLQSIKWLRVPNSPHMSPWVKSASLSSSTPQDNGGLRERMMKDRTWRSPAGRFHGPPPASHPQQETWRTPRKAKNAPGRSLWLPWSWRPSRNPESRPPTPSVTIIQTPPIRVTQRMTRNGEQGMCGGSRIECRSWETWRRPGTAHHQRSSWRSPPGGPWSGQRRWGRPGGYGIPPPPRRWTWAKSSAGLRTEPEVKKTNELSSSGGRDRSRGRMGSTRERVDGSSCVDLQQIGRD